MIKVHISTVDGGAQEWVEPDSFYETYRSLYAAGVQGKQLIDQLISDDWAAPPVWLSLEGTLDNGIRVKEHIPYR